MSGAVPSLNITPGQPITVNARASDATKPASNDVSIVLAGTTAIAGWTDLVIGQGIETCPNSFTIEMTERYPGQASAVTVAPGTPCKVLIGTDTVVSGYVDRYRQRLTAGGHTVQIQGRGACEDIVDCSAVIAGMQQTGSSLVGLARALTGPFGVTVLAPDGDGTQPYLFSINLGETPYELIERVARYEGFLVYEDSNGSLVLGKVGTNTHASGFAIGQNVQAADVTFGVDQRFSDYIPVIFAANSFADIGPGNFAGAIVTDEGISSLTRIDGKPRYRPHFVISEQITSSGLYVAEIRAQWECNRRRGRSQAVKILCDTWRDSAGKLWTPNWLAPLSLAALKITGVTWLISSVRFMRSQRTGTTAELELMPSEAFTTDPTPLQTLDWQVYNATHPGASSGGDSPAP